ncbi:hypothetical protein [Phaeodactylibacter luteus]|uniref:T9SS type A sorting domain-containing protein n=1 Tax=Phaeodactylibacter luteus TaxID=1564516 RepID=A0A5C6RW68_9BACT|nr:hypothetical protein [Phaeodactylibacter luteus]TXB66568.1 hypothetical protein FRY97_05115 [Phaeodactylibacter luteus]
MKKLAIQLALLLIATAPLSAAPGDRLPEVEFNRIPAEQKFSLKITNLREAATVLLRDGIDGTILAEQKAAAGTDYAKIFNLEGLNPGTYLVSIKTSLSELVQPIELTHSGAEIDPSRARRFYAPVFNLSKKGYIDISYFAGTIKDVLITIYNNNGSKVFSERLDNVLLVEKRYKLETLPWGRYTIQVETADKVYSKEFDVR